MWSDLDNSLLDGTILQGADLRNSQMRGADIAGAQLQGAYLRRADLSGSDLCEALLTAADFNEVKIETAAVKSTDLTNILNLTQDQVSSIFGDGTTLLPKNVKEPEWKQNEMKWPEFIAKWQAAKTAANL
ncbi:MAG: pentapeptide repeat-containing protein [Rhodobacteraceae bacterium]|nr:pentapeptide repeat-containing protein [Paracoccaceae bacterium]